MAKNIVNVVLISLLIFLLGGYICFAGEVEWQEIGRGILDVKSVLVNPDNPNIIYIGTSAGVFKTEDAGEIWRYVLSIKGQNKRVNFLLFDPRNENSLYAATANGLFYSSNQGNNWSRTFKGKNSFENECTGLAILPYGIYLGTKAGLFVSKDKGRSWHKETGKFGTSCILAITYNLKEPDYIYVACRDGVFRSKDSGQSWEKIFVASPTENGNDAEEATEDQDEAERFSNLRYISIDPNNANCLYLATSRGIYISQDKGQNWEPLLSFGLLNRDVKFLLVSAESCLYAVTKSGVFVYMNKQWQELSLGLIAGDIRFLALDRQNNLYAATDKGLFKTKIERGDRDLDNITAIYCKNEPSISEIQQAAIKYAEVEPEKIMRWRKQAKMKAILPKLTVGLDRSESTNYEIYTSATTRYVYEGPHDKSNGWDITLSWELGDLIWNESQTSIDVRSRLMVQLRDDVLDEVTKLYFERIRVKMEIDNLGIEDRKKRYEKELKLQELTAQIDGLTGGYFSSQIQSNSWSEK
jgi:hypothetical protein